MLNYELAIMFMLRNNYVYNVELCTPYFLNDLYFTYKKTHQLWLYFFFSFYVMYNLVNFEAILYMILIDTIILINYIYQGRIILIKKIKSLGESQ